MKPDHSIQERVRELYERYPYPTPSADLAPFIRGAVLELGFPRLFFHKYWPGLPYAGELDILIAGCGSSQAARYAAAHPKARVWGIDFSEASLAKTRELADRFGLRNLKLERLSLEEAGGMERDFDLIVSTGVLHHLPDPQQGLQALRQLLRPEGVIYWMVYAPLGRDAIYYLQSFLASLGVTAETLKQEDMPALQEMIGRLPPSHPLRYRRQQFPDLMNAAELMDYLLHPRDRPFTVLECFQLARACGLVVQDLFNRAHYRIPPERLPENFYAHWQALPELEKLAAGETYRAGLIRHDIISCRDDRPGDSYRCREDDRTLIPVKAPGLQLRRGVVRWPGHSFADIELPLDGEQVKFINAVNGERTVAELVDVTGCALSAEALTRLLRELREHDCIWFRKPLDTGQVKDSTRTTTGFQS